MFNSSDGSLIAIAKQLERIADALEESNKLKKGK